MGFTPFLSSRAKSRDLKLLSGSCDMAETLVWSAPDNTKRSFDSLCSLRMTNETGLSEAGDKIA